MNAYKRFFRRVRLLITCFLLIELGSFIYAAAQSTVEPLLSTVKVATTRDENSISIKQEFNPIAYGEDVFGYTNDKANIIHPMAGRKAYRSRKEALTGGQTTARVTLCFPSRLTQMDQEQLENVTIDFYYPKATTGKIHALSGLSSSWRKVDSMIRNQSNEIWIVVYFEEVDPNRHRYSAAEDAPIERPPSSAPDDAMLEIALSGIDRDMQNFPVTVYARRRYSGTQFNVFSSVLSGRNTIEIPVKEDNAGNYHIVDTRTKSQHRFRDISSLVVRIMRAGIKAQSYDGYNEKSFSIDPKILNYRINDFGPRVIRPVISIVNIPENLPRGLPWEYGFLETIKGREEWSFTRLGDIAEKYGSLMIYTTTLSQV